MTDEKLMNTCVELKKSWKTILNFLTAYVEEKVDKNDQEEYEEYRKSVECALNFQDHIKRLRDYIEELQDQVKGWKDINSIKVIVCNELMEKNEDLQREIKDLELRLELYDTIDKLNQLREKYENA